MRLSDVKAGSFVFIDSLPSGDIRRQAIRLGLLPGARVLCLCRLPDGPIILLLGSQEIAAGRQLAERISVRRWGREGVQSVDE